MTNDYTDDLRRVVSDAMRAGVTKNAIAKSAGYNRGRFINWTNDPEMGMTLENADRIREACIQLTEEKELSNGQKDKA